MYQMLLENILFLIPLFVLSFFSCLLIIERYLTFFAMRNAYPRRIHKAIRLFREGNVKEAIPLFSKLSTPEARLLQSVFAKKPANRNACQNLLHVEADSILSKLERNLSYLSGIANVATLFGLLGTVLGMIVSFYQLNQGVNASAQGLAGGISQALLTTAGGLMVAIPSMVMYYYFTERLNRRSDSLEETIFEILSLYEGELGGNRKSPYQTS